MNATLNTTGKGFTKGIAVAAAVVVAAIIGNMTASAAGLPPSSVGVIEGTAGGAVIGAYAAWLYRGISSTDTETWDVMNTAVPDAIERNDFMTVVSNPENGPGVVVWDREVGYQVGVFDSEEMRESVWLTSDEEVEKVVEIMGSDCNQKRTEEP